VTKRQVVAEIKDLLLFLGGLAGIGFQLVSGDVNVLLLLTFTSMTGMPRLATLISSIRGTIGVTGPRLTPPVSQPSSTDSPESSTNSDGDTN
jgi:hypothetical protein